MIKLRNMLIAVIAITALSSTAFAGSFGVGFGGHAASVSVDGTEAGHGGGQKSATGGNDAMFGSYFFEYNFGDSERFTLGADFIPGSFDINRKTLKRTDPASGDANDTAGDRSANATISDHVTYYADLVIGAGVYVKAGFAQVDIETKEASTGSGTTGSYPNKTLDAWTFGLGQKGDFGSRGFYKVEGYIPDYNQFEAASTTGNTVTANLDVGGASFKLGMKF